MAPYALPAEFWVAGLVFIRVAAIVMLLPGTGETFVPPRIRLSFALVLTLCIIPIAASKTSGNRHSSATALNAPIEAPAVTMR